MANKNECEEGEEDDDRTILDNLSPRQVFDKARKSGIEKAYLKGTLRTWMKCHPEFVEVSDLLVAGINESLVGTLSVHIQIRR